jgi:pyruvate dehydrogenase E1 component alpha subunit
MDVIAVKEAGERAVAHCRAGNGPYLLEMKTYRYAATPCPTPPSTGRGRRCRRCGSKGDCIETARKLLLEATAWRRRTSRSSTTR